MFYQMTNLYGIINTMKREKYLKTKINNKTEINTSIETNKKSSWPVMLILTLTMVICMGASLLACILSIQKMSEKNSRSESTAIANMVSESIENTLIRPIIVAETMSQDYIMRQDMRRSFEESPEAVEGDFAKYLASIRDGFGYQMVYAVCKDTNAYYTYNGIAKFVDIENDPHDVWYRDFLNEGKHYSLNIDTDEANNWSLAVFVNLEVLDTDDKLLGVCGIGVEVQDMADRLTAYEEEYGIKINLVDHDGLILLDSDPTRIENTYLDNSYFKEVTGDNFYYQRDESASFLTKYIKDLDWYIVVQDKNPQKIDTGKVILPSIIIFIVGIAAMGMIFSAISIKEYRTSKAYLNKYKDSVTDELTGMYNRRKFDTDCDDIKKKDNINEYAIVMMDLNGLKMANDYIGHEAGDELLVGAAQCMMGSFSRIGDIYRIGGDEFVALLKCTREEADDSIRAFDYLVSNWRGKLVNELSVSKGVVVCRDHSDLDMEGLKALADKLMYVDKDAYYKRTGKDRRKQ